MLKAKEHIAASKQKTNFKNEKISDDSILLHSTGNIFSGKYLYIFQGV
jgi:hypothetical protein